MTAMDMSLGFYLIGVFINVWLYGFTCVQAYIYFARFKRDPAPLKIFVLVLFLLDTTNSVLMCQSIYMYVIRHFGDFTYAVTGNDTFVTDPIFVGIIAYLTQLFYSWRIAKLISSSHLRKWVQYLIPTIIVLIGFIGFAGSVGTTIGVAIVRDFARYQLFKSAVAVWLSCAVIVDVMITFALVATLSRARTGFVQTDDTLTKIIRLTLQTGMITSTAAVVDLIVYMASPTTLHLIFNIPLAKLYINSLFSTLNARALLKDSSARVPSDGSAVHMRHMSYRNNGHRPSSCSHQTFGTQFGEKKSNPCESCGSMVTHPDIAKPKLSQWIKEIAGMGALKRKDELHIRSRANVADGIQIVTVHEQIEEGISEDESQSQSRRFKASRLPSNGTLKEHSDFDTTATSGAEISHAKSSLDTPSQDSSQQSNWDENRETFTPKSFDAKKDDHVWNTPQNKNTLHSLAEAEMKQTLSTSAAHGQRIEGHGPSPGRRSSISDSDQLVYASKPISKGHPYQM